MFRNNFPLALRLWIQGVMTSRGVCSLTVSVSVIAGFRNLSNYSFARTIRNTWEWAIVRRHGHLFVPTNKCPLGRITVRSNEELFVRTNNCPFERSSMKHVLCMTPLELRIHVTIMKPINRWLKIQVFTRTIHTKFISFFLLSIYLFSLCWWWM